jgi:hypothetical protein
VRAHLIVILSPTLELVTHVGEDEEHLDVQPLVAQPSIKRLDITVFHWPARPDEFELYTMLVSLSVHRLTDELGAIIHCDRNGCSALCDYL